MQQPQFERFPHARLNLDGRLGQAIQVVTGHWLLTAPLANPAMLEMFRDRDAPPQRHLVPWAGEFAGRYLTSAVQVLRITEDPRLRAFLETFVRQLLSFQAADGYLGPWPRDCRLSNWNPHQGEEGLRTWDTWGHYHVMLGLLLWYDETGQQQALDAAARIADLMCQTYLGPRERRLVDTGSTEMNLAPVHSLCLLYRRTGTPRYLALAQQIVDEFAARGPGGPLAGDYLRQALAGREFYQMPKPRWESLHPIMGLAELYWITCDTAYRDAYRTAFERIWWSIVQSDRHNNGGFSSGEKASGNPYDRGAIETCCTIAWMALSVEMLKLTGDPLVADEIELSTLNSVLGMHSPTGRWATYNTPMDGVRRASAHEIVFQAREGSPELNCCSVNSPRGFGLLSEWAVMRDAEGVVLNYYGPSTMGLETSSGVSVTLGQETDYPVSGRIVLHVDPERECAFPLKLRIPRWSRETSVKLSGQATEGAAAGHYLTLDRAWQPGDTITLDLDMSLHAWPGERESSGLTSVYRGPILLAYDHRYNLDLAAGKPPSVRPQEARELQHAPRIWMPTLDALKMVGTPIPWAELLPPWLLFEFEAENGQNVRLCDFASAGQAGTPYRSWLDLLHAPAPRAFSQTNPLRSVPLP